MRPAAHQWADMINAGHTPGGIADPSSWPWTWHRLLGYCKTVHSVYERAAYCEDRHSAVPPRWMFWEPDELDQWFEEHRKQ